MKKRDTRKKNVSFCCMTKMLLSKVAFFCVIEVRRVKEKKENEPTLSLLLVGRASLCNSGKTITKKWKNEWHTTHAAIVLVFFFSGEHLASIATSLFLRTFIFLLKGLREAYDIMRGLHTKLFQEPLSSHSTVTSLRCGFLPSSHSMTTSSSPASYPPIAILWVPYFRTSEVCFATQCKSKSAALPVSEGGLFGSLC